MNWFAVFLHVHAWRINLLSKWLIAIEVSPLSRVGPLPNVVWLLIGVDPNDLPTG